MNYERSDWLRAVFTQLNVNTENFPAILKKKYKIFFPYGYKVISTLVETGKTRNLVKTIPHNFLFFEFHSC